MALVSPSGLLAVHGRWSFVDGVSRKRFTATFTPLGYAIAEGTRKQMLDLVEAIDHDLRLPGLQMSAPKTSAWLLEIIKKRDLLTPEQAEKLASKVGA